MKIKLLGQYRKQGTGKLVFRYAVTGSKEQLEAYKEAQGENYVETEDGVPLFFTTRFAGKAGSLIISSNGSVSADMSEFDQAASLIEQFPGPLGQAIAAATAQKLMGGALNVAPEVKAEAKKPIDQE